MKKCRDRLYSNIHEGTQITSAFVENCLVRTVFLLLSPPLPLIPWRTCVAVDITHLPRNTTWLRAFCSISVHPIYSVLSTYAVPFALAYTSGACIRARGPKCQKLCPKTESGLKFLRKARQALYMFSPSTRGSGECSISSTADQQFEVLLYAASPRYGALWNSVDSGADTDILGPRNAFFGTEPSNGVPVRSGLLSPLRMQTQR